jgi:peptidoglycan biosynthesis protein MviN/MurJ (putative lipid II flippase)
MSIGKPKAPTIAFAAAGVLNVALSVLLVGPFGLAGIALGTAVPNAIFAVVVLAIACRELGIPLREYAGYVVPRAAAGAVPVLVLLMWFKVGLQVQTLTGLVAAGSAMLLMFGFVWILFVYRNDPYVDLKPHLVRLRAWSRA